MKLHKKTGRRIISVPLIRDKTERNEQLQGLKICRKEFARIKNEIVL
ncbi:hypothetical protein GM418_24860 [Maribellus comscasis]|uniref:Uncharacterized protein n=1 Tax=Maribellus comscasis TaxID=2681766 RepID=A0A6I6JPX5_9BACT|nr:hypothetical protein [Maribellus comscasis]QGY42531.1 hypothetical protein GM418_02330 [Maribellus comscasis]QGY43199.1 hypothetical protein GM418_05850 [Maribellus comscasis]QGY44767.1 hypothetical protein GM418_14145 [Maribellus comscasis]QGY46170.1 hypothetical protein GM418_21625 [Maribellus comscasis]QGY46769.1 hypothetical protein GM418_24860 [Maribellus comscasis]